MNNHERNSPGQTAKESIIQSINTGAGLCAAVSKTIWERGTQIDPYTGEVSLAYHIIAGRPGTTWNKFYTYIIYFTKPFGYNSDHNG